MRFYRVMPGDALLQSRALSREAKSIKPVCVRSRSSGGVQVERLKASGSHA